MDTNDDTGVSGHLSHNLRRLNLSFKHQRLISIAVIIFIWSLSYVIIYSSILHNEITANISNSTAKWYLSYYALILSAACFTIISRGAKSIIIGLIYIISAIIAIIALYFAIKDICDKPSVIEWRPLSLFSSNALPITLPLLLSIDTIFNINHQSKRIIAFLVIVLITSLSNTIFATNRLLDLTYLEIVGLIGWWMVTISSLIIMISIIFFNHTCMESISKIINIYFISQILLVIGACLTFFNASSLIISTYFTVNLYHGWILLLSLSMIIAYELECILSDITNIETNMLPHKQPLLPDNDLDDFEVTDNNNLSSSKSLINSSILKDYISRMYNDASQFSLSTKPQRLVIYNLIMFIWCLQWLPLYVQYLRDSWYFDEETRLKLQISAVSIMLCASVMGIQRKWTGLELEVGAINLLWLAGIVLNCYAISYFIKECGDRSEEQKCKNAVVGRYFMEILLPLIIMMDTGLDQLFDDIAYRVRVNSLFVGLKALMVYIPFDWGINGIIPGNNYAYQKVQEIGYLLLTIQFVIVLTYYCCPAYQRWLRFVISGCTLIGVSMAWNYYDWQYEFLILIPFCALLSFDMLQLHHY